MTTKDRPYVMRVLIALDQLGNAITGGHHDETISSRLGKRKLARGGYLTWSDWLGLAKPLDAVLDWLDPGHSLDAIETDEGRSARTPSGNAYGRTEHE